MEKILEIKKVCLCCKKDKEITKFSIIGYENPYQYKRDNMCDSCNSKRFNILNVYNGISFKEEKGNRYKKYKITQKDYNNLFIIQEGKCLICSTHQSNLKKKLAVDHNHQTSEVRGLLCANCNAGLGMFKDNEQILKNAVLYLRRRDSSINL